MQKDEIWRITVPGQLRQKVCKTSSQQQQQKAGCGGMGLSSQLQLELKIGGPWSKLSWAKSEIICKITRAKRAGGMAQVSDMESM
jgi:hypothetical protein